jgi:ubiquitin-activating enzyme E1
VGKPRIDSIYKLQELNHYVKVSKFEYTPEDLSGIGRFQVVIATGIPHEQQLRLD